MNSNTKIRVGALEGFRELVFELGGNPSFVLKQAGINEDLWKTPDALISTENFRTALNCAASLTNTPRFGLLLSQRQSIFKIGAVGYLIGHAPNLLTAIEHLPTYLQTHDSGTMSSLVIQRDIALVTHTLAGVENTSAIQQTELAVGFLLKFIRDEISTVWSPDAVYFSHSRPERSPLYRRIFRCPVYFDHDLSGFEFKASLLTEKLINSDAKLYKILFNFIEQSNKTDGNEIVDHVKRQIHMAIDAGSPSLNNVAQNLGLGTAELQRLLKRSNTNFQTLLETERYGLACKLLLDTSLPLSNISILLAYAEPAVFSRAFKRLSGVPPRVWRQEHQGNILS